jgi:hypothetical protein
LAEHPQVWAALLGEQRALSPSAARLITSMSYYPDDLALLSWNGHCCLNLSHWLLQLPPI